ncbi:hypothetical protein ABPG74_010766 [Tetrahymena malaccensis]
MGLSISKLLENLFSSTNKKLKILMLGLDGAGKTSLLYKMKLNQNVMTVPTIGFNMETVQYKNIKFNIWDIGGQDKIRILWKHYYPCASAIIFVVDSSDVERLSIAKYTLFQVLNEQETFGIPVLIFANKIDVSQIAFNELSGKLGLHELQNRKIHLQQCCALTGEGMFEGFEWLNQQFKN